MTWRDRKIGFPGGKYEDFVMTVHDEVIRRGDGRDHGDFLTKALQPASSPHSSMESVLGCRDCGFEYTGRLKDGAPDGRGSMKFIAWYEDSVIEDGTIPGSEQDEDELAFDHVGFFHAGKRHGRGKTTFSEDK